MIASGLVVQHFFSKATPYCLCTSAPGSLELSRYIPGAAGRSEEEVAPAMPLQGEMLMNTYFKARYALRGRKNYILPSVGASKLAVSPCASGLARLMQARISEQHSQLEFA